MTRPPRIELRGIRKHFGREPRLGNRLVRRMSRALVAGAPKLVRAVENVDLAIMEGEVLGLIGESGCGKSTLGRIVAGVTQPSAGEVLHRGCDLARVPRKEAKRARLNVQMVFQDPYASLNPRLRVDDMIGEAPLTHRMVRRGELAAYVDAQLRLVGLDPALKQNYPHQFSGGQRQRICIARALAVQPDMLVCDEAVAALDVSIQAQILNLFMDLRQRLGLTYLFISHDLGVVGHLSGRVAVMYLGRIVEQGPTVQVFARPNHPYTQTLLADVPRLDARKRRFAATAGGELPSPLDPPPGCHFHPRCPYAMRRCAEQAPSLREIAPGHRSACHLNDLA